MSNRLDQEREKKLQPKRMEYAKKKLQELGYEVQEYGGNRLEFTHQEHKIQFYPYSGWATGKTIQDGRGIKKLLKQLTPQDPEGLEALYNRSSLKFQWKVPFSELSEGQIESLKKISKINKKLKNETPKKT